MIFPIRDAKNHVIGDHVTWLSGDLKHKRQEEPQRQAYGPIKGGLAEGIETALSMAQLTGCPAIADPGADLVRLAHARGIRVVPLVGPSAILLALMAYFLV